MTKPTSWQSFFVDVTERMVRTFAQTMLAALGVGKVGFTSMPWVTAIDLAGGATAISLLLSLASLRIPRSDLDTGSLLPPPAQTPAMIRALVHPRSRSPKSDGR